MYVCMSICMYVLMYVGMHACRYVYVCMFITATNCHSYFFFVSVAVEHNI